MARNSVVMGINIRQDRNEQSRTYGRYYPVVGKRGTLSTVGLAQHMVDHGSLVSEEILRLVLGQLAKCMVELISQGMAVKLDGLGIFRPTVKSTKGGAATVVEASRMGAANLVEGVHIRFYPEAADLRDITSKALKKKCSLQLENVIELEDGEGGRRLQTLTPLDDWIQKNSAQPGGGDDDDDDRP